MQLVHKASSVTTSRRPIARALDARRVLACRAERGERLGLGPKVSLTKEEALDLQLQSLQMNNMPYRDHGVEVMYRFASFDPFCRSDYFGRSLDLGQFERFKRVFFTPWFQPLLGHHERELLSQLSLSDTVWKVRVLVRHGADAELHATYDVTLVQARDGVHKARWMTQYLLRDDGDGIDSYL